MIFFIGGIHGAGKGTICRKLSEDLDIRHFTASQILKWYEVSPDTKNKNVEDILFTQDRLIKALHQVKEENRHFILDGHFCLFNKDGIPKRVPQNTFEKISPDIITVISDNIHIIKKRLENRDQKKYLVEVLSKMQDLEVSYAEEIAKYLCVPYIHVSNGKIEKLRSLISKKITDENLT